MSFVVKRVYASLVISPSLVMDSWNLFTSYMSTCGYSKKTSVDHESAFESFQKTLKNPQIIIIDDEDGEIVADELRKDSVSIEHSDDPESKSFEKTIKNPQIIITDDDDDEIVADESRKGSVSIEHKFCNMPLCSSKLDHQNKNSPSVSERITPVNVKRTYCELSAITNHYGYYSEAENDSEVELMEASSGKLREQWEKASLNRSKNRAAASGSELQILAEDAQKLERKRKAEVHIIDVERRQRQRLQEVRDTLEEKEENRNLKELLRDEIRNELNQVESISGDMASLLKNLGIPVGCGDGFPHSPKEVEAAYKRALLKFHPDRASRTDIRQQIEAEEIFKLISHMKGKEKEMENFPSVTSGKQAHPDSGYDYCSSSNEPPDVNQWNAGGGGGSYAYEARPPQEAPNMYYGWHAGGGDGYYGYEGAPPQEPPNMYYGWNVGGGGCYHGCEAAAPQEPPNMYYVWTWM